MTTIVFILLAVAVGLMTGVIVGWMIGYFHANWRASKNIAADQARVKAESSTIADDPGLLRLKNIEGVFSLEMDGVPLEIKNVTADQKKRLIELLSFIRPWLEGGGTQPSASAPTPSQPFSPLKHANETDIRSLSIVAQINAILQMRLTNTPFANQGIGLIERTPHGGLEVHVGSQKYISLEDVPSHEIKTIIRASIAEWERKSAPAPKPAAAVSSTQPAPASIVSFTKPPPPAKPVDGREFKSLSIVAQIDTVLQARLENSPLADKGIRLIERTALGGVEVYVGNQKYPSLDDVPDQEIKTFIRTTIEEWEKKYTPGM